MDIDEKGNTSLIDTLKDNLKKHSIDEDLISKLLLIINSENITETDFNFLLDFEDSL